MNRGTAQAHAFQAPAPDGTPAHRLQPGVHTVLLEVPPGMADGDTLMLLNIAAGQKATIMGPPIPQGHRLQFKVLIEDEEWPKLSPPGQSAKSD